MIDIINYDALSVRTARAFEALDLDTWKEVNCYFLDIMRLPGVGKKVLREIVPELRKRGYHPPTLYSVHGVRKDGERYGVQWCTFKGAFDFLRMSELVHCTITLYQ